MEVRREEMPFQVIDGLEWKAAGEGDGPGRRKAHQERSDEPRPGRGSYNIYIVKPEPGSGQSGLEGSREIFQMRPRRDLRHHAAVQGVRVHLRGDHVGENAALSVHDGDGRLVTGGFDAEDEGRIES